MANVYQYAGNDMTSNVIVTAESETEIPAAQQLADELGLTFTREPHERYGYLLIMHHDYLGIQKASDTKMKPFYIDLLTGTMRYRSAQAGLKSELLARAMGAKPKDNPTIIDTTAGLGRDSFILATLGFKVTLLERSPIIFALLRDAMQRAATNKDTQDSIARMQLIHTDAIEWLSKQAEKPQVIYLDPMFPKREKAALVKKEMVILQNVVGKDLDANQLFDASLACANKRVVVKRPRLAPTLSDQAPNFTLTGRSSRFDIYTV